MQMPLLAAKLTRTVPLTPMTLIDSTQECVPFNIDTCDAGHLFTTLVDNGVVASTCIYLLIMASLFLDIILSKFTEAHDKRTHAQKNNTRKK